MVVRFKVPENAAERVAFAYSPAMEAVLSLHILVEPKHHPLHHEWVRQSRHRLSPGMKRVIAGFRFAHSNYLPPVLLPSPVGESSSQPSFEEELARLQTLGAQLGMEILRYFAEATPIGWGSFEDPAPRTALLREVALLGPSTLELTQLGLEDPTALAQRFLDFLYRYWGETDFAGQWARTEPILSEAITNIGHEMAQHGLFGTLSNLKPSVGVDENAGEFWIHRHGDGDVIIDDRSRFVIAFSGFLWPHISLINDPPNVGIVYPVTPVTLDLAPQDPPTELVSLLKTLADPTRLCVLRLIAEHARSTQELASLLHTSEAAMSKHLRQLTEAGLLDSQRDGYYVLYYLIRKEISRLPSRLAAFLDSSLTDH